ncbi:HNH endonuclease [Rhizobium ruizarguesonis]|uniref:HNH endonuclease n=1 Tax=Rhizobium ruizarguesonis TaxID=2081791 RepID=A0AAE8TYU5_9HYPH|nr:HNH endonuclease [Rhizobium ruizarguesonis]TBC12651.1 HNH endonuclease [Rhizobium ruizarguesonis]TBF02133.1 HNH endonuclease [Rhizobium ruizarguesonis]TCA32576.1 HNH endonuclease [Rhizobium leguminosarum bv. viciae]
MNRKAFIQSHGAECRNWNWSWSFINEAERFIIFGMWQDAETKKLGLILHKGWEISAKGRKNNGYGQAIEHIRLIEEEGYQLKTFPMIGEPRNPEEGELSASKIIEFTPELSDARLIELPDGWYASHTDDNFETIAEVVMGNEEAEFWEGAAFRVHVNAYERNAEARKKCLQHFGFRCRACDIDFGEKYGVLGQGYIHVHHIKPIHQCGGAYKVDPIKDLVPVCANCHAMIHRRADPLTVDDIRAMLIRPRQKSIS